MAEEHNPAELRDGVPGTEHKDAKKQHHDNLVLIGVSIVVAVITYLIYRHGKSASSSSTAGPATSLGGQVIPQGVQQGGSNPGMDQYLGQLYNQFDAQTRAQQNAFAGFQQYLSTIANELQSNTSGTPSTPGTPTPTQSPSGPPGGVTATPNTIGEAIAPRTFPPVPSPSGGPALNSGVSVGTTPSGVPIAPGSAFSPTGQLTEAAGFPVAAPPAAAPPTVVNAKVGTTGYLQSAVPNPSAVGTPDSAGYQYGYSYNNSSLYKGVTTSGTPGQPGFVGISFSPGNPAGPLYGG